MSGNLFLFKYPTNV